LKLKIYFFKIVTKDKAVKLDLMKQKDEIILSSAEAAELLQVHVSSIKRWSQEGRLLGKRTPGGHRRFTLEALLDFARQEQLRIPLLGFAPFEAVIWEGLQQLRARQIPQALLELVYQWLREGKSGRFIRLIILLHKKGIPIATLGDCLLGPLMTRIGRAWESCEMSIGEEHRMTHTLIDALYALRQIEEELQGRVAVVACPEGAYHELGALLVRLILEEHVWQVLYLGADVPIEEIAWQQQQWRAELVALSFVLPLTQADVLRTLRILTQLYENQHPYTLVLGGRGVSEASTLEGPFKQIKVFKKLNDFETWLRHYPS
jgi:excisionase family DNA binding protein